MSALGDGAAAPRPRDGRQQRHGRQEPLPEELQRVDGRAGGHAAHHGAPGGCYFRAVNRTSRNLRIYLDTILSRSLKW